MIKPFVKYVGGKGQLLEELLKHVPKKFKNYHEPMVGGGALFWALVRENRLEDRYVDLSDENGPLIETYKAIRDNPKRLIRALQFYKCQYVRQGGDLYYRIRDAWNEGNTNPARFIFLKQTSFNGLWRYNQQGKLNMPWGHYENPKILDGGNIVACSMALQGVSLWHMPFPDSLKKVAKGDLVYLDPPYWGRFDLYGPEGFTAGQHVELVKTCARLQSIGAHIIYSNEDSYEVRRLIKTHWPKGRIHRVQGRRFINCDGHGRQPVGDLIVVGK